MLYEFKAENPEGYKGVQAFFQKIAPMLDPSVVAKNLDESQYKPLLKMQIALAHVECGVEEIGIRARSGEKNLAEQFSAAIDRVADSFGGYEKFFDVQNLLSDGQLKKSVEQFAQHQAQNEALVVPHVENNVPSQQKPSWQAYVSDRAHQPANIAR
ncbi:MAG: hypothetical protein EAZ74_03135 [Alphaproteobacteria bacterium]|nr:MAG: hypothetical protein EAY76_06455 [Alphaproteobacteria bacterium]TAF14807.1 MAG: hypothetical protein EAZ74_03135 [Alphaproteobacteria bacterium]TAF38486.1 MAG: hypothetical protein EAZ66_06275 [Alphaproteobacteria bacterium]